ncbi:PmoA family protein [Echinicola sp. CAU 1574]|uniref:PmoA family protein n=1 Tax=Echinicola arenosa TaxID=2774144 RepID=A0ABR9APC9_9BACT|nr:DUF6807 family protein [Echinicola arenosa]MBD8490647.1 PmoA family protein [Echinicola arenosa]
MKTKLLFIFLSSFLVHINSVAQELAFEKTSEGILLKENNQPRYFYQTATKTLNGKYPRANYVHPLYGLNGEVLTEDFPEDHFHHRGIFWTWHQLYVNGKRIADPWFCEGISWKVTNTNMNINDGVGELEAEVAWVSDSLGQSEVLRENVKITYERLEKGAYALTFEIKLNALVDNLELGGSEDQKGYGGFSPRVKLPEDIQFSSEGIKIEPQTLPVQAGPWMNLIGSFDNHSTSGIVIMGEPQMLTHYQGWILRSAKSMQNMAFPGRNPIRIPKGEPLQFRNQIIIHQGLKSAEISHYYKKFTQTE